MINIFKKIFGKKETEDSQEDKIKSIPLENFASEKIKLELDELFASNFTENGGKFIYCIDDIEVYETISEIYKENNWDNFLMLDDSFKQTLNRANIPFSKETNTNSAFFTGCEALIAENGSILISSNQTKGISLADLPYDFIILAHTKELLKDRSDGLTSINLKHKSNIPSGITTIKGPNTITGTDNILDSGSINTSKNIYLVLIES